MKKPDFAIEPQDAKDHDLGLVIIGLLNLKLKKNGRVDTAWGDKNPCGLTRSIERLIEELRNDQTHPTPRQ